MGIFVIMKKFFVGLPVVFGMSILPLIGIAGFVWEITDVGGFVLFAFITSIVIPLILEIIVIVICCQYIIIDENGIRKYLFKKKIVEYKWEDIKEIRVYSVYIYISLELLKYEQKEWDRKKLIVIMYSDKAFDALKKHIKEGIVINF